MKRCRENKKVWRQCAASIPTDELLGALQKQPDRFSRLIRTHIDKQCKTSAKSLNTMVKLVQTIWPTMWEHFHQQLPGIDHHCLLQVCIYKLSPQTIVRAVETNAELADIATNLHPRRLLSVQNTNVVGKSLRKLDA